jgi:hypothetical protein
VTGVLWTFSTSICATLDDFESYTDTANLGGTWKDFDNDTTSDNAVVNNLVTGGGVQVYEGDQSMRVVVDQVYLDGAGTADDYTWREYADLDLTADGGTSIWTAYRAELGSPPREADTMYVAIDSDADAAPEARIDYPGDVCDTDWAIFFIALSEISDQGADPCNVDEIRIGMYGASGS